MYDEVSEDILAGVILELGIACVKPQQLDVISAVWKRVFTILSTAFGKSVCFQCLPLWKVVNKTQNQEMVFFFVHSTIHGVPHEQM